MSSLISGEALALWRKQARQNAIADNIAPDEVDWLLREITDLTNLELRLELFKARSHLVVQKSLDQLNQLWQDRLEKRLPVQYLVGVTPWRNFKLKVTPDVLIPRPETEYIIDLVQRAIAHSPNPDLATGNWVDLGTGSGAIALGLADILTKATIYAIDASEQALAIAQENAQNLEFSHRISFKQGSWWSPLTHLQGQISGMVSNPPYIPTQIINQLQPEVRQHEPHQALDGGQDGLDCIRHLVTTAPDYLVAGGVWLIEIMAGQAAIVKEILQEQGSYHQIQIFKDLAGIERFILAYRVIS